MDGVAKCESGLSQVDSVLDWVWSDIKCVNDGGRLEGGNDEGRSPVHNLGGYNVHVDVMKCLICFDFEVHSEMSILDPDEQLDGLDEYLNSSEHHAAAGYFVLGRYVIG